MFTFKSSLRPIALGAAFSFIPVSAAHAALYGNLTGPTVAYSNINESDNQIIGPPVVNSTPVGLFGPPVLSPAGSDNMAFPAMTFSVLVAQGEFELQDGKLNMDVAPASPAATIHGLIFDEGGAWRVQGPDFASSPTTASAVDATMIFNDVRITALDGVSLLSPIEVNPIFAEAVNTQTGTAHTATSNGEVSIASAGTQAIGTWELEASFDLDSALAAAGKSADRITGISVGVNDQLFGETSVPDGGVNLASIDKKHFFVIPVTTTTDNHIPEPAANVLLLGSVSLLLRRRRMA